MSGTDTPPAPGSLPPPRDDEDQPEAEQSAVLDRLRERVREANARSESNLKGKSGGLTRRA